ncbi:MAG: hypothetical protein RI947_1044 [Candidatus Parcubacteria bacterium]|jgi:hypothetical protein
MSHKTFLIIGLLAITNLLTVLALNVTQKEYTAMQSRASFAESTITSKESDGSEDFATIDTNDFATESDEAQIDANDVNIEDLSQPEDSEINVEDGALNSVSGDDFSTGLD